MGCDIHLYAEKKIDGKWMPFDEPVEDGENDKGKKQYAWRQRANGRNYNLFGILANVRNGSGFAGTDTGDGFVPISEPRGLPGDLSDAYKLMNRSDWENAPKESPYGWFGDHSHSYLDISDMLAYDWDRYTILRGVVSFGEFSDWYNKNSFKLQYGESGTLLSAPKSWSGGVSGPEIETVDMETMEAWLESLKTEAGDRWGEIEQAFLLMAPFGQANEKLTKLMEEAENMINVPLRKRYCTVQWHKHYADAADELFKEVIWPLKSWCDANGYLHDKARIVFGFDS